MLGVFFFLFRLINLKAIRRRRFKRTRFAFRNRRKCPRFVYRKRRTQSDYYESSGRIIIRSFRKRFRRKRSSIPTGAEILLVTITNERLTKNISGAFIPPVFLHLETGRRYKRTALSRVYTATSVTMIINRIFRFLSRYYYCYYYRCR